MSDVGGSAGESATLDEFTRRHAELTGSRREKWQSIPWRIDLLEARQAAAASGKPIFLWSMNGHPLGCTCDNGHIDRALIFADDGIVELLSKRFVPVAVDEKCMRLRQDVEGGLYRRIVYQRRGLERKGSHTTQGFYICTANGRLIAGWNNRDVATMRARLDAALEACGAADAVEAVSPPDDDRAARELAERVVVVDVFARIVSARWPPPRTEWEAIFQRSTGRDHLWIARDEARELARGVVPLALARRIARFHLVDNTRGEPPMWEPEEVRSVALSLVPQGAAGDSFRIDGAAHLETKAGDRGYEARLAGVMEVRAGKIVRFDLTALGDFWGGGLYTKGAPPGRFRLAVAFKLAEPSDRAFAVPPPAVAHTSDYLGVPG